MAKIINLKAVKKRKSREKSRQKGDENAASFGLSKSEKLRQKETVLGWVP